MGTLYTQAVRKDEEIYGEAIDNFFEKVLRLAKKHNIKEQDIIEGLKVLELKRKNNLFRNNGDIHDEQMAGMGKEIQSISTALENIAEAINNK